MKRILCFFCTAVLLGCLGVGALAAEVDSGDCYCFAAGDFGDPDGLAGICITRLPEESLGTVMLGERCLRPGDVLTTDQILNMTFVSTQSEEDSTAFISFLPVFASGIPGEATMTLAIRGRENKAPIAEDTAFETYKNLELEEKLRVRDPEAQAMTFTVVRQPKRGSVTIHEDGSFTYTPKKNKVGIDSFTYTAADPAGKVSREATVTVTIMKPCDAKQYSDTVGKPCRFAAEWMKSTGIFVGETLDGNPCFAPDRPVTRGEFLTMLVKTLKEPVEPTVQSSGYPDAPAWLRPYLAAAVRSGLTEGIRRETFGADEWITAEDAAAMICSALSLEPADRQTLSAETAPADVLTAAAENGFFLSPGQSVTRADAAIICYHLAQLLGEINLPRVIS